MTKLLSKYICHFGLIFSALLMLSSNAFGQKQVPSVGTEFWIGFMQNYSTSFTPTTLEVSISSKFNTSGTISIPNQGVSHNFNVTANQTTSLDLQTIFGLTTDDIQHVGSEVIENKGILVQTQDTVSVFAMSLRRATSDAAMILPTVSLGTDYVASCYYGYGALNLYSEFVIVATEDNTVIDITPAVQTLGGRPAQIPFQITLNKGESYQVQAFDDGADLTGTTIVASDSSGPCRPFAVFSGSQCTKVPNNCTACDHVYEMNFSVDTWGTDYFTIPFSGSNSYTYRVLAKENGTIYTVDGIPQPVLNAGDFAEVNLVTDVHCISSNKGISVSQFMEGFTCVGTGDPAMLILNAKQQQITNSTFTTSGTDVIDSNYINLVVETPNTSLVSLDGSLIPSTDFTAFTNCPAYSYARIYIDTGTHNLNAPVGFNAYCYGNGRAETYAYVVGSSDPEPVPDADTSICTTDTVVLSPPEPIFNPWWSTNAAPEDTIHIGFFYKFLPQGAERYILHGDAFVSGCPKEFYFDIEKPDTIDLSVSASGYTDSLKICKYQTTQLDVNPSPFSSLYEYTWSPAYSLNNANIKSPIATPFSTTWYHVTVSTPSGCVSGRDSFLVVVENAAISRFETTFADSLQNGLICLDDSIQLQIKLEEQVVEDRFDPDSSLFAWSSISNGKVSDTCGANTGNGLWFNGPGIREAITVDVDVSTGGTIQFYLKIATGTFPCDDVNPGEDIVLEYSINAGGSWTTIKTYNEAAYPFFTLIQESIPMGARTASTRFRWRQLSHSGMGQDNWVLDDVLIGTDKSSNYSLVWSPSADLNDSTATLPWASPSVNTTYTVIIDDTTLSCPYADSITVEVGQPFTLDATDDTLLCDVDGIALDANPSAGTNHTYAWSPSTFLSSATIKNPTATPPGTITYSVTATSEYGCTAADTVTITVNQLIDLDVSASKTTVCEGDLISLYAFLNVSSANLSFQWSPPNDLDNPNSQYPRTTPDTAKTYKVIVTDTAGCSLSDSVFIDFIPSFEVDLGPDTTLCNTNGFQLFANHTSTSTFVGFQWNPSWKLNASWIQDPLITWEGTESYSVTVTDFNGRCTASDTINITSLAGTANTIGDTSICSGDTAQLYTSGGSQYQWSPSASLNNDTIARPLAFPSFNTEYVVTITHSTGCQIKDSLFVNVIPYPNPNLGADISICANENLILNPGFGFSSYNWSTGVTSPTINTNTAGIYSVSVTNFIGCLSADTIAVSVDQVPIIYIGNDTTFCENVSYSVVFDPGTGFTNYLWDDGSTDQIRNATTDGTYHVEVTDTNGCKTNDTAIVTHLSLPIVNLGNDTGICDGMSLVLSTAGVFPLYNWSTGSTVSSISVNTADDYMLTVTGQNGCSAVDTINVTILSLPNPQFNLDTQAICQGQTANFSPGPGFNEYEWSSGATTSSISLSVQGPIWVTVTDNNKCSNSDSAYLVVNPLPVVFIGNDSVICGGDVIVLNAGNPGSTYLWSTGETTQSIKVVEPNTYSITVTSEFNCVDTASVTLRDGCAPMLWIPNSFTPNGDGKNDVFSPKGLNITGYQIHIYDRWGERLFTSDDINLGWDGSFRGRPVENEVYIYKITYQKILLGQTFPPQTKIGHVALIR